MAKFIARVELHNAAWDDYETLHASMAKRGFAKTILGGDGVTYLLPTGTYDAASATFDLADALARAKAAAAETGKTNSIIVAERSGATWNGLKKA